MKTPTTRPLQTKIKPAKAHDVSRSPMSEFVDNRPVAVAQRKLQEAADDSPQVQRLARWQAMANRGAPTQIQEEPSHRENKTGLPDRLKIGIERLSGIMMDDVKVHHNSSKPAQLQALAYTRGTDIHIESGQGECLSHEAWHVVQQKQGRVVPNLQVNGVGISDDQALEHEAEVMGAKALGMRSADHVNRPTNTPIQCQMAGGSSSWVVQRLTISHQTVNHAPGSTGDDRKTVGVRESVLFESEDLVTWGTSAGTVPPAGLRSYFRWEAPVTAGSVTIRAEEDAELAEEEADLDTESVRMNVVTPEWIRGKKTKDYRCSDDIDIDSIDFNRDLYEDTKAWGGMTLDLILGPDTVSFGGLRVRERSGDATNVEGYFEDWDTELLRHHANHHWIPINNNNAMMDVALTSVLKTPYRFGRFDWIIPYEWADSLLLGREFPRPVRQTHTIGKGGSVRVKKSTATTSRDPKKG